MKGFIYLILVCLSLNSHALEQKESADYNEVAVKIRSLGAQFGPENVLIVHDLDNTLLAMKTDIGSDQWFDWQSALLKGTDKTHLVANDFNGLLKLQGQLYTIGNMRLTQNDLPDLYRQLNSEKYKQILLTSRGPDFRDATEKELLANKLPVWNESSEQKLLSHMPYDLNNLNKSCLTEEDKISFKLADPRLMSTGKNIILSSGQHKGMVLKTWLCSQKASYKAIVFIDDKIKNVDHMAAAFPQGTQPEMFTFRYSKEDERVKAFHDGDKKQAIQDAADIQLMLSVIFGN